MVVMPKKVILNTYELIQTIIVGIRYVPLNAKFKIQKPTLCKV